MACKSALQHQMTKRTVSGCYYWRHAKGHAAATVKKTERKEKRIMNRTQQFWLSMSYGWLLEKRAHYQLEEFRPIGVLKATAMGPSSGGVCRMR